MGLTPQGNRNIEHARKKKTRHGVLKVSQAIQETAHDKYTAAGMRIMW